MNMRIKLLIVIASLLTLVFALNLGVASADKPHDNGGGIDKASSVAHGGLDTGVAADVVAADTSGGFGLASERGGISNNPLCPLHYGETIEDGIANSPWAP